VRKEYSKHKKLHLSLFFLANCGSTDMRLASRLKFSAYGLNTNVCIVPVLWYWAPQNESTLTGAKLSSARSLQKKWIKTWSALDNVLFTLQVHAYRDSNPSSTSVAKYCSGCRQQKTAHTTGAVTNCRDCRPPEQLSKDRMIGTSFQAIIIAFNSCSTGTGINMNYAPSGDEWRLTNLTGIVLCVITKRPIRLQN